MTTDVDKSLRRTDFAMVLVDSKKEDSSGEGKYLSFQHIVLLHFLH
jgi:hypothetical protein